MKIEGPKPRDLSGHKVMLGRKAGPIKPERGNGYNRGQSDVERRQIVAEAEKEAALDREIVLGVLKEIQQFDHDNVELRRLGVGARDHESVRKNLCQYLMRYDTTNERLEVKGEIGGWIRKLRC